jgi:hypothetical protein
MAQNLKINITAQDKTKQALGDVRGRLAGLKRAIFSVQGALVGLGAGLAVRLLLEQVEALKTLMLD